MSPRQVLTAVAVSLVGGPGVLWASLRAAGWGFHLIHAQGPNPRGVPELLLSSSAGLLAGLGTLTVLGFALGTVLVRVLKARPGEKVA